MNLTTRIIIYALILSILYYLCDSVIDHFIFFKELSFMQVFITSPPVEALFTRLFGMAAVITLGLFISIILRIDKGYRGITVKPEVRKKMLSLDPNLMVNLSHQIKTPLNAIVGFSDLLKDQKISIESRKIYINHISTSGKYLLELVNNITDITKIETDQMYVKRSGCMVNKLLHEIYSQFEKNLKEEGKKKIGLILKTSIKDENFTLLTDREKLKQILTNLLENAVRLTDEGYIEFGYQQKDDLFLEFYVRDTGSGLSMERLEMIMEHFQRVVDKRMQPFDTAALRINIANNIVRLLGGKLTAESVLCEGSTFTFTIPLHEVEVYSEETRKKQQADLNIWSNKQILIAEDVESNFIYLQEILKPTGVQIQRAVNGREAVELCKKNENIALILMDILMPEMDGYEAAMKIKEFRPNLPVIAQTAYSLEEDDYKEVDKYFDSYMIKPIWSHELLNTLSKFLV